MRSKYKGALHKESLYELVQNPNNNELIVFIHGFMGFMDWGAWHLVANYFYERNYDFCRFNLSHNGTSNEAPSDFVDLEAFGNNTYSIELFDTLALLDHIENHHRCYNRIHLIGHSRGGGNAILAGQNWKLKSHMGKVITWASICDIARRFPEANELEQWKQNEFRYIINGRTKQEMPQNFTLYTDYLANQKHLDILGAARELNEKLIIFHGDADESVPLSEAFELAEAAQQEVQVIRGADHVFGASHPWNAATLPPLLEDLCAQTLKCL